MPQIIEKWYSLQNIWTLLILSLKRTLAPVSSPSPFLFALQTLVTWCFSSMNPISFHFLMQSKHVDVERELKESDRFPSPSILKSALFKWVISSTVFRCVLHLWNFRSYCKYFVTTNFVWKLHISKVSTHMKNVSWLSTNSLFLVHT